MLLKSQTQMILNARALVLLHILVWSLPDTFSQSSGILSDSSCLKSIRDSLEDPLNHIATSWTFNSSTEDSICWYVGIICGYTSENRVRRVQLANMGLKGKFPRGLVNCSELIDLDLSGNVISGSIPHDINEILPNLEVLELSNNNLSGEIPSSMGNCSNLEVVKLNNNRLSGQIPHQLSELRRLRNFTVANNLLSGPVPDFIFVNTDTITPESYVNNSGLCGEPLDGCKHRWDFFEISFRSGFVEGFLFFASSYTAFFTYYFNLWGRSKRRNQMMPTKTRELKECRKNKVSKLVTIIPRMSLAELSEATANFNTSNVIGLGKIGMMYKGMLSNGRPSAIKRLHDSQSFEKQFASELKALGRVRHENIVPLLGYCIEGKEKLLVYEYISNGNLYDWLHAAKGRDKILKWPLRIEIAIGIARGLAWFHHYCNFNVVHLNLSSNSILLDQNFRPKISNFGGSIISNFGEEMFKNTSNTFFIGDDVWELGYVKKDVYDFGILLLELIIGKESIEINNYANNSNESLVDWIAHLLTSSSDLYKVIDESLIGQGFEDEIFELLRIAYTCLKLFPSQRPTTLELYNTICIFGERVRLTHNSEILRQSEIATASNFGEIVEAEIT